MWLVLILARPEKGKLETAKKNLIKNKEEISALSVVPSENIAIDEKVVERGGIAGI